jgi:hypothetical protein
MAEENSADIPLTLHGGDGFSARSSFRVLQIAQAKRISASRFAPFPHFHSDGYYYGLPTSYKTG